MKMTEEQLKEIIVGTVKPLLIEHGKTMDEVRTEVDSKIKEMTGAIENKAIQIIQDEADKDPKAGFKTFSHFAKDVARASIPGGSVSKELVGWDKIAKAADSTSMIESEDQFGGFLIPPEFRQDLWMAVEQKNEILPRCTQIPMARNQLKIPFVNGFDESGNLVYGGIQWLWRDELGTKTAVRPRLGQISLDLKKVTGLANSSDELLEDSPISLETLLKNGFRDGLHFQLNKVLLAGSGAGQPLGILNAPCTVSVAKETGQAANTIVYSLN